MPPEAVIAKLRDTYVAAVADPVVRQKVSDAGAELLQSSPHEMADHMRKEAAKWAEVIRTTAQFQDMGRFIRFL
jgi:tripartite-type tricarboxylate transporter receptor subunit TctC